jgi:hypothetical protein
MRQDIADQINRLMMEYQSKLNASTLLVQETCTDEEFQVFRLAVGRATDFMFNELTRAMQMSPPDHNDHDDYDYDDQTQKMLV